MMKFGMTTWSFLKTYEEKTDLYAAVANVLRENFGLELFLDWYVAPELLERKKWNGLKKICRNSVGLSLHSKLIKFF